MITKTLIISFFFISISFAADGDKRDFLLHGCKMGVAITQGYLNKDSDFEMTRMHLRCDGGISRRPKIREEFNLEQNKEAYACGVGIGVAAGFYEKQDLLKDKQALNAIVESCVKAMNKSK
jgi:hypothetical protein